MRESQSAIRLGCLALFILPLMSYAPLLGTSPQQHIQESCRSFVKGFYDWYVTQVFATSTGWLEPILKNKSSDFSPELLVALREYAEAPGNSQNEIDELDFDPFLHAQDNADRYLVEDITRHGGTYWVEVYGIWSAKKNAKPDVMPELMLKDGRWLFVNFHYGKSKRSKDENLLSILKRLREDRQEHLK
jgi:hypothetical protein